MQTTLQCNFYTISFLFCSFMSSIFSQVSQLPMARSVAWIYSAGRRLSPGGSTAHCSHVLKVGRRPCVTRLECAGIRQEITINFLRSERLDWLRSRGLKSTIILCHKDARSSFDGQMLDMRSWLQTIGTYNSSQKKIPDVIDCNLMKVYQTNNFRREYSWRRDATGQRMTVQVPTSPNDCFCTTCEKRNKWCTGIRWNNKTNRPTSKNIPDITVLYVK